VNKNIIKATDMILNINAAKNEYIARGSPELITV
jgi:hypothetical protein